MTAGGREGRPEIHAEREIEATGVEERVEELQEVLAQLGLFHWRLYSITLCTALRLYRKGEYSLAENVYRVAHDEFRMSERYERRAELMRVSSEANRAPPKGG